MGRIAGVTAEETRAKVLASAASVFARKGYDGASIAQIAADAGVTGGAIYSHFPSKAELFVAALHAHGAREVDNLLDVDGPPHEAISMIRDRGLLLVGKRDAQSSLIVEAIVAAKRHPDVAALLAVHFTANEAKLAARLEAAQAAGALDGTVPVEAVSRFLVMLSLGALLLRAMDLPQVDEDDWSTLITDLVSRFSSQSPAPP
ncbi:MAG: TetR/AcrR family transcriptional regulator [Acidimicrobiia bacterium]|nr:TetR/AcrR family transcriptional regulator [Acidimicrobiia bacterium]